MKHLICMIVTLLLSLTTALAANALTGDGTAASPYLVSTEGDTTLVIHSDGADCTVTATQCDLYPSSDYGVTYSSYNSTFSLNGSQVASPDDFYYSETAEIGGYSDSWKVTTITQDTDPNANTAVNHTVAPAYTVTIPTEITLGETATIKAEDVLLEIDETLTVTIKDKDNDDFTVKNNDGNTLNYTVTNGGAEVKKGDTVLSVESTETKSVTLSFVKPAETDILYPGQYIGYVTFTISVSNAA